MIQMGKKKSINQDGNMPERWWFLRIENVGSTLIVDWQCIMNSKIGQWK